MPIEPYIDPDDPMSEQWALFDMDGSLADFERSLRRELERIRHPDEPPITLGDWNDDPSWLENRKTLIKRRPGFWENLEPIQFGLDLYHWLGELGYRRGVFTKGPRTNYPAWAEKMVWCNKHLPDVDNITMTLDKGGTYGKILYEDYPTYILQWLAWRPRGRVLLLDAPYNRNFEHPQVLRCYRESLTTQKDSILRFIGRTP